MNTLTNIQTKRLILVPVSDVHTKEIFENFNEQIIFYMEPQLLNNMAEAHRGVKEFIKSRENNTDYVYAITLKTNSEFIGIFRRRDDYSTIQTIRLQRISRAFL